MHFLLGKALQRANQLSKSKLESYHVTPVQYALLAQLWVKDGQFSHELSKRLLLDSATITGIVDRLEQQQFIERRNNPNDRRTRLIYLTEQGKELEGPLEKMMTEMNEEIVANLDEGEKKIFLRLLYKIGVEENQFM